eukprot:11781383-Alexandrium_andersonii.AAC.1
MRSQTLMIVWRAAGRLPTGMGMPSCADTGPTIPAYARTGTTADPLPAAHAVGRSTSLRTSGAQDRRTTHT